MNNKTVRLLNSINPDHSLGKFMKGQIEDTFLISQKTAIDSHANCLQETLIRNAKAYSVIKISSKGLSPKETVCSECQSIFSRKINITI